MNTSDHREPAWLIHHAKNVYSQFGEDGVIETALQLLPHRDMCCVEFGAWDGLYLSNTANLIRNHEYRGVFIEGDPIRVEDLKENYQDYPHVRCFTRMVGWNQDDGLDAILSETDLNSDFDLLSIDIDGNDYHVWDAFKNYQPKLVVIEFNQTIPVEVDFVQPRDPSTNIGTSISELVRLGNSKGYQLISILRNNLLFVREDYFELYGIQDNRAAVLRQDTSDMTWMFFGYDGSINFVGARKIPWHDLTISQRELQIVPKYLQRFPPCYNRLQNLLAGCFRKWRRYRDGSKASN